MRKQPLFALGALAIALSAVSTLGASTIAGASTDGVHAVPTGARADAAAVRNAPRITEGRRSHTARAPLYQRSLVVMHDLARPPHLKLNPITGLPFVHKKKPRRKPPVVEAPPPATVPPTTVPPATVPPTTAPPVTSSGGAGGVWYELRMCESGGDYSINTGNGFYGAYQFALSTWLGLGFTGLPSNAPPAVQDRAARELQANPGGASGQPARPSSGSDSVVTLRDRVAAAPRSRSGTASQRNYLHRPAYQGTFARQALAALTKAIPPHTTAIPAMCPEAPAMAVRGTANTRETIGRPFPLLRRPGARRSISSTRASTRASISRLA